MLYEPLCHLSSLYAAAIEAMKDQPIYPDMVGLADSVLHCLGQACLSDESHTHTELNLKELTSIEQFLTRIKKVHALLNIWVDDRQFVSLLCQFELRWQGILRSVSSATNELGERLFHDSEYRLTRLHTLQADIEKKSKYMQERYGEPVAI